MILLFQELSNWPTESETYLCMHIGALDSAVNHNILTKRQFFFQTQPTVVINRKMGKDIKDDG